MAVAPDRRYFLVARHEFDLDTLCAQSFDKQRCITIFFEICGIAMAV